MCVGGVMQQGPQVQGRGDFTPGTTGLVVQMSEHSSYPILRTPSGRLRRGPPKHTCWPFMVPHKGGPSRFLLINARLGIEQLCCAGNQNLWKPTVTACTCLNGRLVMELGGGCAHNAWRPSHPPRNKCVLSIVRGHTRPPVSGAMWCLRRWHVRPESHSMGTAG